MALIETNGEIPAGLRADIMRRSMENKNLLEAQGALYVGTGDTLTIEDSNEVVVKTRALAPTANDVGFPLVSNGIGADIAYQKLTPSGIELDNNVVDIQNPVEPNHIYYIKIDDNGTISFSPAFYVGTTSGAIYVPTSNASGYTITITENSGTVTISLSNLTSATVYLYKVI